MTSYNPKDEMFAKVVLASTSALTRPIYTLHLRYPRIIHAEAKTHRALSSDGHVLDGVEVFNSPGIMDFDEFSRNARSSRAVPVKTMLEEVRSRPFVPWHWGKNQKGMQADEECNNSVLDWVMPGLDRSTLDRTNAWCQAATQAIAAAEAFSDAGYHKQIANRLLEPFSWIDTLVTSTDWANFDWLRDHKDAEPHFRDLAQMVIEARRDATVQELKPGRWHQPYITQNDRDAATFDYGLGTDEDPRHQLWLNKISAARCARISYTPFDGSLANDYDRELARYDMLVGDGVTDPVHASPTEHIAQVDTYFTGQELGQFPPDPGWANSNLSGNLAPGYIQFRKTIPGEARHD